MKRIQFKADAQSDKVEVKNGDYRRVFERADQPFNVKDEVWPMLRRTGHFEEAKAEKKAPPPATAPPATNGAADNK